MSTLDAIKEEIQNLYKTNPNIHISVTLTSPRVNLSNEPAVITGIYPHIFQIEEKSTGSAKRHTLQYADVLTNNIDIFELNKH